MTVLNAGLFHELGNHRLASMYACQLHNAYQTLHGALDDRHTFAVQLVPVLACPIETEAVLVDALDGILDPMPPSFAVGLRLSKLFRTGSQPCQ